MKTFETVINSINFKNKDDFEELTLVDESSFLSIEEDEIKVQVYSHAERYICIKTKKNGSYMVEEVFPSKNPETGKTEYSEDRCESEA